MGSRGGGSGGKHPIDGEPTVREGFRSNPRIATRCTKKIFGICWQNSDFFELAGYNELSRRPLGMPLRKSAENVRLDGPFQLLDKFSRPLVNANCQRVPKLVVDGGEDNFVGRVGHERDQIKFNPNVHLVSSSSLWTLLSCTISSNSSSSVRISPYLQWSQTS